MSSTSFTVGGLHKLTTVDFPGLVSALVFTQGCNFHCPYCHNPQLLAMPQCPMTEGHRPASKAGYPLDELLAFLRKRAGLLDGLVISGGEPTLHSGLADFCRQVTSLGYKVKLDTNGSRPDVLRALVSEHLVEYVALDLKTIPESYDPALCSEADVGQKVIASLGFLQSSGVEHEVRTTCVQPFVTEDVLKGIAQLVGDRSPWFLQKARLTSLMGERGMRVCSGTLMSEVAQRVGGIGVVASVR